MSVILGLAVPLFALPLGLYGVYRLTRMPDDSRSALYWRWIGIAVVILLALYWGMRERVMRAG